MTTKQKIYVFIFLLIAFGGAYLLAVAVTWFLIMALNAGFSLSLNVNVWIAGLFAWLIVGFIRGIINLKKSKLYVQPLEKNTGDQGAVGK